MKRSAKCIAQTINLSQPKTCSRPHRVQKLINADVLSPCPGSVKSPYQSPRPVAVRVCTRRDMERVLPPEVCDCPQKLPPDTTGKIIFRWMKCIFKSAVAAGLVYWTKAEGFWGDGRDAEDLYHRIMTTIAPAFEDVADLKDMKLPHLENMKYNVLDAYNKSVLHIVELVVGVPLMLEEKIYEVLFSCDPIDVRETAVGGKNDKQAKKGVK